jgi:hypothetical protein
MKMLDFLYNNVQNQDSKVSAVVNRLAQISSYGYRLSFSQKQQLAKRLKLFGQNGGQPDLYFDPSLSVNPNLLTFTEDFTNAAWRKVNFASVSVVNNEFKFLDGSANSNVNQAVGVLQNGQPYTFSFEAKQDTTNSVQAQTQQDGGSFTSVGSQVFTGLGSNYQKYSFSFVNNQTFSQRFTYGVGTIVNASEGNIYIRKPKLEIGSVASNYTPRLDATAVKALNLGKAGVGGDLSYLNGTTLEMSSYDATVGQVLSFLAASTYGLQCGNYKNFFDTYTVIIAFKPSALGGALLIKSNTSDRFVINADGTFRFSTTTGAVQSSSPQVSNNAWNILGFSVSSMSANLYKNGANVSASNTITVRNQDTSTNWSISTSAFLSGLMGEIILIPNVALNDSQHLNIYNGIKSKYGL